VHWSHDCAAQIGKAVVPTGSVNGGSVAEDVDDVEVVGVVAVVGFGTVAQSDPASLPMQEHIPHEEVQKTLSCEQHPAAFQLRTLSQQAAGGCGVVHGWMNGHLHVQAFLVKLDAPVQHS
jgi:hypothetical protein